MLPSRARGDRLPRDFSFQYAGLLLFMIGDGIETGFLSPYLVHLGFGVRDVSLVFTIYGVAVAAAAWASGLLCDAFGPRRVILTGFGIWLLPQLVFLLIAVPHQSFWLVLMSYGIRGPGILCWHMAS